jgi:hypothetical protein
MDLIAIHRRRHYSDHSTTPPHRPSPSPSPYKRAPPSRSIPHLSHPSPALFPSSPLASIGASTAARSMLLQAHLRPSSASPTSPPASPSSPTPPWLLTASFSAPKHHSGQSLVTPPPCSPAVPPTAVVAPASFFPAVKSKMDAPDQNPEGVSRPVHHGPMDRCPFIGPQACGLGPRDFF